VEERIAAGLDGTSARLAGSGGMIQITPQRRVLVAIESVDGRKGIDSLSRLCQERLAEDPYSDCLFIFRSRSGTTVRLLTYDGQGYWLLIKRLSQGRFCWSPEGKGGPSRVLEAWQAQVLLAAGHVSRAKAAPVWRPAGARRQASCIRL
jgi:transposase